MNQAYLEELKKLLDNIYKNNVNLTQGDLNHLERIGSKFSYKKSFD